MTQTADLSHMLLGALVADAAALGVHWIYDPSRIVEIAAGQNGRTAFTPIDPANYENTKGYFAHEARHSGQLTQYGESLYLAVTSTNANDGAFDPKSYQTAFAAHFGAGGSYQGYIDRPTRGTLANIAAEIIPSGIDDDQLPAVSRLPAIFAAYHGQVDLADHAKSAMEITNVNEVASDYTGVFLDLFNRLIEGEALPQALESAAKAAPPSLKSPLEGALSSSEANSTDYAETTGRACHLPMAGPLIFHILRHADSYAEAIERNNLAGGDNAGRSLLIGGAMGLIHGLDGAKGIPLDWTLRLKDGDDIWANCQSLVDA